MYLASILFGLRIRAVSSIFQADHSAGPHHSLIVFLVLKMRGSHVLHFASILFGLRVRALSSIFQADHSAGPHWPQDGLGQGASETISGIITI